MAKTPVTQLFAVVLMTLPVVAQATSLTLKTKVTVQDTLAPPLTSANVTCHVFDQPLSSNSIAGTQSLSANQAGALPGSVVPQSLGSSSVTNLGLPLNNQEVSVKINFATLAEMTKIRSYACYLTLNANNNTRAPLPAGTSNNPNDLPFQATSGKPFIPVASGNI